jgi:predicted MPP superfamily phosphohydrolase
MDKRITTIAHLSDLHIRRLQRHREYRHVFERTYTKLKELAPDVITVTGDVVHGKIETSPEEMRLVAEVLEQLSNITTTIIIPGNHDCLLGNLQREDVISPIYDLLKEITPNIRYWKESGVKTLNNVSFGVLSVMDGESESLIPDPNDMDSEYKICLFHGGIGSYFVDSGITLTNENIKPSSFDGYDIVCAGDIHLPQTIGKYDKQKNTAAIKYPGSLIRQNYGEGEKHGFLMWDLESRTSTFHEITNDYAYHDIKVINGATVANLDNIPIFGKLKIKYEKTSLQQLDQIIKEIKEKRPHLKNLEIDDKNSTSITKDGVEVITIGDVNDVNYQNELIKDYASSALLCSDEDTMQRLYSINKSLNNSLNMNEVLERNIKWKLKHLEFDNMFSYGKGNAIDFDKLKGIVGLIGPNASGKSSIPDIIAYTGYDMCSRTSSAIDVLNTQSEEFSTKMVLNISGEDHTITRNGTLGTRKVKGVKKKTCAVKVGFEKVGENLAGASRRNTTYGTGTNEEIRKRIGTFSDFVLTALSSQNNGINLLDKKQGDRKRILSQFIGIDIFEQLFDLAKQDIKDDKVLLKRFNTLDHHDRINTATDEITHIEKNVLLLLRLQLFDNETALIRADEDKELLLRDIKPVDKAVSTLILEDEERLILKYKNDLILHETSLKTHQDTMAKLKDKYMKSYATVKAVNEAELVKKYNIVGEITKDIETLESEKHKNELQIEIMNKHISELETYEYDSDCAYCVENGQTQILGIDSTSKQISDLLDANILKNNKIINLVNIINTSLIGVVDEYESYLVLKLEFDKITQDATNTKNVMESSKNNIERITNLIDVVSNKIDLYKINKDNIKFNEKITSRLGTIKKNIEDTKKDTSIKTLEKEKADTDVIILQERIKSIKKELNDLIKLEQRVNDYDLYIKSVSKDGIQFLLIKDTISLIEYEINKILDSMSVEFTVKLAMDTKNIDIFICRGDLQWPLELSSGMERFVSSIAIRVGLINVCNLPKPTFFIIDEGWGTLDPENLVNMSGLFQYLRNRFDFVLVISHIDGIRDFMDDFLVIDKEDGDFSKISYN